MLNKIEVFTLIVKRSYLVVFIVSLKKIYCICYDLNLRRFGKLNTGSLFNIYIQLRFILAFLKKDKLIKK